MTNMFEGKSSEEIEELIRQGQKTLSQVREEEQRGPAPSQFPLETLFYLHSDKGSNRDTGRELGLTDEQLKEFAYVGYEVKLTIEIQEDGSAVATAVNDVALTEKVKV